MRSCTRIDEPVRPDHLQVMSAVVPGIQGLSAREAPAVPGAVRYPSPEDDELAAGQTQKRGVVVVQGLGTPGRSILAPLSHAVASEYDASSRCRTRGRAPVVGRFGPVVGDPRSLSLVYPRLKT